MSNLLWVVVPLFAAVVVASWLAYQSRKPKSLEYGIEEFQRELRALSPQHRRRVADDEGGERAG